MTDETPEEPPVFKWQVTCDEEGAVNVSFGPMLSALPIETDHKLMAVGKSLVNLGTQLMTSTVNEDEWDDEDGE